MRTDHSVDIEVAIEELCGQSTEDCQSVSHNKGNYLAFLKNTIASITLGIVLMDTIIQFKILVKLFKMYVKGDVR